MKFFNRVQSEDLPHVSGIKTTLTQSTHTKQSCRKTCPTYRGLRLTEAAERITELTSEDLPHVSGIKTDGMVYDHLRIQVGRLAPRIGD